MAYSMDYRIRAVEYKEEGHTFQQLREAFGIPSETYYDWKKKLASGYYKTKSKQVRKRKIDKEQLKQAVEAKPDSFLSELAEPYQCSPQAVSLALKGLNITRKKRLLRTVKNQKKNAGSM